MVSFSNVRLEAVVFFYSCPTTAPLSHLMKEKNNLIYNRGLVAAILSMASVALVTVGLIAPFSTTQIILNLPILPQELVFAAWLIAKGFAQLCDDLFDTKISFSFHFDDLNL